MINDITGEAEEIRAAIRATAARQYVEKRAAAAEAVSAALAPVWQQRLDALRAQHAAEENALKLKAYAAIYGEEAVDAEMRARDYAAYCAIYKEQARAQRRARRLAWRRAYYQKRKGGAARADHNAKT